MPLRLDWGLFQQAVSSITNDAALKKKFDAIKKLLEKNITVRDFRAYIAEHSTLLSELSNVALFREKIWKSYFKKHESQFNGLLNEYDNVKTKRKQIEDAARKEQTQWEQAIALFNDRFSVPFTLVPKNKVDVALRNEAVLDLGYSFHDDDDSVAVEKETLMKTLSQGERKALYILSIIFEIEVRRSAGQETLFVVDDIADSFDYKNKYAIIQYLSEISEGPVFKQIILTHNFDFFRTVESRFVGYDNCLMATKSKKDVTLYKSFSSQNIFIKVWKPQFFADGRKRISCIPFMRNLIEYTRGSRDADYSILTSLLHWKSDSSTITESKLDDIYKRLFPTITGNYSNPGALVIDLIMLEAGACVQAQAGANFENKIVLAIAIRLTAEQFMVKKIADAAFVGAIKRNQTTALLKKFKNDHSGEIDAIKILNGVVLMTPENIHLNAFMYEPILDMSDDHLRHLYTDVAALK